MDGPRPAAASVHGLARRPVNVKPFWAAGILFAFLLVSHHLGLDPRELVAGLGSIGDFLRRFTSPNFEDIGRYGRLMVVTLSTALWGTFIALVFASILAPLAASPLTPNRAVYRCAREVLNLFRAIPDLLLAIIFVAALGLGPMPGALALGLHTGGFAGRILADCLERVPPGVYEALKSTGASRLTVAVWGGWPSILQEAAGYGIYVFDRNVRAASMLGLVGAGGIGAALLDTIRLFEYEHASALVIVMAGTIVAIDAGSAWLRGKLQ
jgi:phosphonate transport system permease protein